MGAGQKVRRSGAEQKKPRKVMQDGAHAHSVGDSSNATPTLQVVGRAKNMGKPKGMKWTNKCVGSMTLAQRTICPHCSQWINLRYKGKIVPHTNGRKK